jgi:hypothetical protein
VLARGRYSADMQDDVLFTAGFYSVVAWLDARGGAVDEPWCVASLFDSDDDPASSKAVLCSSIVVRRKWEVDDGRRCVE